MVLSYKSVKKYALALLTLPCIVFALGWLKWYWAVVFIFALCFCYIKDSENTHSINEEQTITITVKTLIIIGAITLVWVWLSGIGGYWAQSEDFPYRNAIFRDIVLREWPVKYDVTGHALVYYIGVWLVPAVFGKIALFIGANDEIAFQIANGALYVWIVLAIYCIALLGIITIKAKDKKQQILVFVLFIFFSGADLICSIGNDLEWINYHYEWWATYYQYSSFTTCLFWVYNQAVPAWICILCLLNEKSSRNYVFLGMLCLFNAPLPFVGLFIYCIASATIRGIGYIRQKVSRKIIVDTISVSNIISTIFIFPIISIYMLSNEAINGVGAFAVGNNKAEMAVESLSIGNADEGIRMEAAKNVPLFADPVANYISFICIEFLIVIALIWWKNKKNPLYYVTFASLILIPLFKIGNGSDFVMRVSIPALVVLYTFVAKFLIEEKHVLKLKDSLKRLTYILLVIFIVIGAATPLMEMYRGIHEISEHGVKYEGYDNIYTLGCDGPYDKPGEKKTYGNFVATDIENKLFFKVFCK